MAPSLHRTPLSRRRFLIGAGGTVGVVALGGGLLGACGGDDSASPSGANGGGGGDLATLALQAAWINDAQFMGYYIAVDNGYYEAEGVDLQYLSGGPDILPESQLLSGQAQIALTTPDTTATAILEQGAPFKIIATMFQQSPLGVLSLADGAAITSPDQLAGRTIATGTAATAAVEAMLRGAGVDPGDVTFVPYSFDPQVVLDGEVDAAAEFCPDTPFVIEELGGDPVCTSLYEMGYRMFNNTVVVTEETLSEHRDALVGFLRASRRGWEENFVDPDAYPPQFVDTWFEGTGRSVEHETYFNNRSEALMAHPDGFFSLSQPDVDAVVATLQSVGIDASSDMFDLSLMEEVNQG